MLHTLTRNLIIVSTSLSFLILASCSSVFKPAKEKEYISVIKKFSQQDRVYSGVYNLYNMNVTILNSEVTKAQIDKLSRAQRLTSEERIKKQEESQSQLSQKAQFFMAFYTPNRRNNDLIDGESASWRFFLIHNQKHYSAEVTTSPRKENRIKELYPYFTRFHKPYLITFDIPMTLIENKPVILIIQGSSTSRKVRFNNN